MRCAAALSTHPIPAYATGDVIAELLALDQPSADLVVAFATPAFGGTSEDITETMRAMVVDRLGREPGVILQQAGMKAAEVNTRTKKEKLGHEIRI